MWYRLEHLHDRNVVAPGASSFSLRGLTWSAILAVTRSPLEFNPARYVASPERHSVRSLISPATHPDRYRSFPDRHVISLGAPSCALRVLIWSVILIST